ncbi:hypothetical protein P4377_27340 [Bacillus thuringiensis]|nr:hypothetical protein [Bacillus thuringiensis]
MNKNYSQQQPIQPPKQPNTSSYSQSLQQQGYTKKKNCNCNTNK